MILSNLDYFKTIEEKEAEYKNAIKTLNRKGLIGFLINNDFDRNLAAEKLGNIGDSRAIPHLVNAFGFWDDGLKFDVVRALEKLGQNNASEVVPHLMKRYSKEGNEKLRLVILKALETIGDSQAIPILGKALNNDLDIKNRIYAAKILARMGDSKAVPHLLEALKDSEISVREAANFAISNCVDSSSIQILEKSLLDNSDVVRRIAEECLIRAKKR